MKRILNKQTRNYYTVAIFEPNFDGKKDIVNFVSRNYFFHKGNKNEQRLARFKAERVALKFQNNNLDARVVEREELSQITIKY